MWRAQIGRSISEVRFVLKPAPVHHGAWRFVFKKLPELVKLNRNTFFAVQPIADEFTTDSACHIIYGDKTAKEEVILTENLSPEEFEKILESKVALGLTLPRKKITTNDDRALPMDIVPAQEYIHYLHDSF